LGRFSRRRARRNRPFIKIKRRSKPSAPRASTINLESVGMSRDRALAVLDDLAAFHQWAYGHFLQGMIGRDPSPLLMDAITIVSMAIGEGPPWEHEAVKRALQRDADRAAASASLSGNGKARVTAPLQ
jgi:hypothetical protein